VSKEDLNDMIAEAANGKKVLNFEQFLEVVTDLDDLTSDDDEDAEVLSDEELRTIAKEVQYTYIYMHICIYAYTFIYIYTYVQINYICMLYTYKKEGLTLFPISTPLSVTPHIPRPTPNPK
jgi:hypothetical protein